MVQSDFVRRHKRCKIGGSSNATVKYYHSYSFLLIRLSGDELRGSLFLVQQPVFISSIFIKAVLEPQTFSLCLRKAWCIAGIPIICHILFSILVIEKFGSNFLFLIQQPVFTTFVLLKQFLSLKLSILQSCFSQGLFSRMGCDCNTLFSLLQ